MKTFLALAVLSLATSLTTQAAVSEIYRPKIYRPKTSLVTTGESSITRAPQPPKLDLIAAEDAGTNRQPPRLAFGSIDGSDLNRVPRPKLGESGNNRQPPRLNRAEFIAAKVRPKVQSAAVTTL